MSKFIKFSAIAVLLTIALSGAACGSLRLPQPDVLLVHEAHTSAAEGSGTVNGVDAEKTSADIAGWMSQPT